MDTKASLQKQYKEAERRLVEHVGECSRCSYAMVMARQERHPRLVVDDDCRVGDELLTIRDHIGAELADAPAASKERAHGGRTVSALLKKYKV